MIILIFNIEYLPTHNKFSILDLILSGHEKFCNWHWHTYLPNEMLYNVV